MGIKSLALMTGLGACLASSPARAGSVELFAGNKNATVDVRLGTSLAPRLELFVLNTSSVDYEGTVGHFGFGGLGYTLVDGLNVLAQAQFAPGADGFAPRFGLEYGKTLGGVDLYAEAVAVVVDNSQAELVGTIGYRPQVTDTVHLVLNLEAVTLLGKDGHDSSAQRLRAGFGVGDFEFCSAANLDESQGTFDWNLGGSVRARF